MSLDINANIIADEIVRMIDRDHESITFYNSEPNNIDIDIDRGEWLIQISDIITSDTFTIRDNVVEIDARGHREKKGYQLRQRNATGGDYCDLEQELAVSGELHYEDDGSGGIQLDKRKTDITCENEINASNFESYSGETPPF